MNLAPFRIADRKAIIGLSGSGKSYLAKKFVARELLEGRGLVAFDPEDEYSIHGRKSEATSLGPLRQRVLYDDFVANARELLCCEVPSVSVIPSDDEETSAEQCEQFVALLKAIGDVNVLFDELGGYSGPDCPSVAGRRAINKVATKGRHWGDRGVSSIFVSQRAVHVPSTARAQLTEMESFLQTNPDDTDALDKLTGDKTFGPRVKELPKHHSLHWASALHKESKS